MSGSDYRPRMYPTAVDGVLSLIDTTPASEYLTKLEEKFATDLTMAIDHIAIRTRRLVTRLTANDKITLDRWKTIFWQKVALIKARREHRIEAIIEAREEEAKSLAVVESEPEVTESSEPGDDRLKSALRKVVAALAMSHLESASQFPEMFDEATKEFRETSKKIIAEIIKAGAQEDEEFRESAEKSNKMFIATLSQLLGTAGTGFGTIDRDKSVASRDEQFAKDVALLRFKRDKVYREIFKDNVSTNDRILKTITAMSSTELDETSLHGRSIEELCFDDDDTSP